MKHRAMRLFTKTLIFGVLLSLCACGEAIPRFKTIDAEPPEGERDALFQKDKNGRDERSPLSTEELEKREQRKQENQSTKACDGVEHGGWQERIAFESPSVPYDAVCREELQRRECVDGTFAEWQGRFEYESCEVREAPSLRVQLTAFNADAQFTNCLTIYINQEAFSLGCSKDPDFGNISFDVERNWQTCSDLDIEFSTYHDDRPVHSVRSSQEGQKRIRYGLVADEVDSQTILVSYEDFRDNDFNDLRFRFRFEKPFTFHLLGSHIRCQL